MEQIYLHASRVSIWVGRGDESSVPALSLIRSIGYRCCQEIYGHDPSPASWLAKLRKATDRTQVAMKTNFAEFEEVSRTSWQPFWHFYQSDWFFRIWVIQEVRRCPNIWLLCGEEEIEWDFVALAANWICHSASRDCTIHWKRDHFPSYNGFRNAFFMWDQSLCTRREAPFPALLSLVRRFHSTDPRDKVFAVLQHPILQIRAYEQGESTAIRYPSGSSSNTPVTHLNFQADYSMTTSEVYRQVALDSIQYYRNLEVMSYAWQTAHLNTSYPSWIPRWDIPIDDNTPLLPFLYDAAQGTFPRLQPSFRLNTLTVQGLNLGSIVETDTVLRFGDVRAPTDHSDREGPTKDQLMAMSRVMVQDRWQDEIGLENAAERADKNLWTHFADFSAYLLPLLETHKQDSYIPLYTKWCNVCGEYISEQRKPTSNLSKLYNCEICDYGDYDICTKCYDLGNRCHDRRHVLKNTAATSFWCPYADKIINQLEAHASIGNGDRFFNIAKSACRHRVFLRTSHGWKGVGPHNVEPGDTLVVLFGSRVPFILRRHDTFYRLTGDCYIHGLMDGMAIQMWEDGELKIEDFDIR